MKKKIYLFLIMLSSVCVGKDWTWNYTKKLSVADARALSNNNYYVFVKEGTPIFTQLIFSWNAHRPKQGHYTFYVQSRNALTKQWTKNWIKMLEWGKDIQRSHCVTTNPDANYYYVRLEELGSGKADAFKIKAECNDGATFADMRLLNVCISNLENFFHEQEDNFNDLKSIEIRGIPKISQFALGHEKQGSMCSTTSLAMLLNFLTKTDIDPLDVAKHSYDHGLGAYGSWPFNTAHAFERCNRRYFKVRRLPSFRDLHGCLSRGAPAVVSVRGSIPSAPQDYPNGHLVLVIGFSNKKVICHDPAFPVLDVRHEYELQDFLKAWERSHRLAYVVESIYLE